jgi:hypothetical protein
MAAYPDCKSCMALPPIAVSHCHASINQLTSRSALMQTNHLTTTGLPDILISSTVNYLTPCNHPFLPAVDQHSA